MREIPSDSPAPTVANSTEGSNPSLTALRVQEDSNKSPTSTRFWSKADKITKSPCWRWTGWLDRDGYGRFKANKQLFQAHRYAFFLATGSHADGLHVRHSCDNPWCVNPDHLEAGSQLDNMSDRNGKGRTAKGEHNGRAKLTQSQVDEIRSWRKLGASYRGIASRFGINDKTVRQICSGKLWRGE